MDKKSKGLFVKKGLFLRKPIPKHFEETEGEHHQLKRHLGSFQLITIGIGAIIGAGIFVITGQAAADYAGPAIAISFVIAAIICLFAGLCYAELASLIPISGGSYSYSYVALGEFPAWIVGWVLVAQYLVSASTVAVGWSGYFVSLLNDLGISFPDSLSQSPWVNLPGSGWQWSGAYFNVPAIFLSVLMGLLISVGIRAASYFNNAMVVIKLSTVLVFVLLGIFFIQSENWTPFIPENTGVFGQFGWSGIVRGAGLVFFAYLGFDTVSTLAQDAKNPQRDIPMGVLGSLGICTIAYIVTSLVLTGVVSYKLLNVPDPMSVALQAMGPAFFWFKFIVKLAILAGLSSVVLVQLLGQTRVFFAISKDGLLPSAFARVHPRTKTPLFSSLITGFICLVLAGLFPISVLGELVSMVTLFLFAIVCAEVLVLRFTHPEYERRFKVPFVPWVPLLGIGSCIAQMSFLPFGTWIQLIFWLLLGLVVYFSYSVRHSKIRI